MIFLIVLLFLIVNCLCCTVIAFSLITALLTVFLAVSPQRRLPLRKLVSVLYPIVFWVTLALGLLWIPTVTLSFMAYFLMVVLSTLFIIMFRVKMIEGSPLYPQNLNLKYFPSETILMMSVLVRSTSLRLLWRVTRSKRDARYNIKASFLRAFPLLNIISTIRFSPKSLCDRMALATIK